MTWYKIRFEVECEMDIDEDRWPNDIAVIAAAVQEYLGDKANRPNVRIKPCHVESMEIEQ